MVNAFTKFNVKRIVNQTISKRGTFARFMTMLPINVSFVWAMLPSELEAFPRTCRSEMVGFFLLLRIMIPFPSDPLPLHRPANLKALPPPLHQRTRRSCIMMQQGWFRYIPQAARVSVQAVKLGQPFM
jgi:hypothetical protein